MSFNNIIITGDFNIHVNDTVDQEAMSFMELMEAVGLTQYVKFPTHKLGNTLDLVFAESTGCMNVTNVVCGEFISDHCFTIWTTSKPRSDLLSKTITIRKLRDIDVASFSADIDLNCVLEIDKLDEILCEIDDNLLKTLDKHAPAKMKTITVRHKQPWFNDTIKHQKRVVRRREKVGENIMKNINGMLSLLRERDMESF